MIDLAAIVSMRETGSGSVFFKCDKANAGRQLRSEKSEVCSFQVARVHNDANLWIFSISNQDGIGHRLSCHNSAAW